MTERDLQHAIRLRLGRERDLVLFRNQVGQTKTDHGYLRYGLGVGSPDLVGILAPHGRWVCLEIKTETGRVSEDQERWHKLARKFGAHVEIVRSVDDAVSAIERARNANTNRE